MIPDQDKTKEQLIAELAELRQQVNPARQTKAEQALQYSEHRFSSITRTTSDAVLITDESGKITFCNLAAEKLFGYAAEELYGKSSDILRPEQFRSAANSNREAFMRTGSSPFIGVTIAGKALKKDGSEFDVEVANSYWKENGRFFFFGIVRDITERKQAEAALGESEAQYRELVESANSVILRFDPQGRITFFNAFAERLFGYSREEIVGKSSINRIVAEVDSSGKNLSAMIDDLVKYPERYAINENENIRKDGSRLWIAWTNKALHDMKRNTYEVLCIGHDITAQKNAQRALRESEEKYRTLLNDATDAILLADAEGNIFEANKQAEALLGYTAQEFAGMNFAALHPEQERNTVIDFVTSTLLPQGAWSLNDVCLLHKDGTLVPADISGRFIEYAGKQVILGTVRNISERKAAAAELDTYRQHLEELVEIRTAELTALNAQLRQEIEERKNTEDALRRSEELFRSVIETSSDAIVTADSSGNIVLWNKAAETIYGYTAAEVLNTSFLAMLPEPMRGHNEQIFAELMSAGRVGVLTNKTGLRGRRKDGSEFPTEGSSSLWQSSDDAFITVTVRDITERKAAEASLTKNKEFYETILNNIINGVWVSDKDDCIFYVNKGMELISGIPREQWPRENFIVHFEEKTSRFFAPYYRQARETLQPVFYDSVPVVTPLGRHTIQSGWLVPLLNGGVFDGMICTVEDVTEHKQAEQALRRNEEQLRQVIENASDAIVTADSSGTIVLWNRAAENIFGYTAGEMLNKPFIHIMPEHLQESHWQQFTTFLAERKPGVIVTHAELKARRKDGSEFPVEGSASLWETSDGVFITSLIRDNTERKRAKDLIKKVNDCLLSFSADPDTNVQLIIEAAGTIFDGASASYHKKRGNLLHIAASWNLPAEYMRAPQLSARRFDELWAHYGDGPFVINNPEERQRIPENSPMLQLGFKNFIATPIKLGDTLIGSLNVAYRNPKTFSPNELNVFSILTKAISIEEERKKVLDDLKQHQLKLKNSEKSLKAFSGRILSIREEEKKNISSALHDEIGSMVIAISSGLAIAKEDIIENSLDPALKSIELTETALRQAVDNLKKIAIDLRPPNLDIVGLSNALKNFFLDIARQTNIVIDFSAKVADKKIDDVAAIVLYRTAQEALNNVVKHAKAKAVSIRLHEKKSNLLFEIADNGRGFNPESLTAPSRPATKIGIQGMRERIAALGGTLIIESALQKGTTLHITIPKRKGKKS